MCLDLLCVISHNVTWFQKLTSRSLSSFQKKSTKGIATPKVEVNLIEKRLKDLIKEKEKR